MLRLLVRFLQRLPTKSVAQRQEGATLAWGPALERALALARRSALLASEALRVRSQNEARVPCASRPLTCRGVRRQEAHGLGLRHIGLLGEPLAALELLHVKLNLKGEALSGDRYTRPVLHLLDTVAAPECIKCNLPLLERPGWPYLLGFTGGLLAAVLLYVTFDAAVLACPRVFALCALALAIGRRALAKALVASLAFPLSEQSVQRLVIRDRSH